MGEGIPYSLEEARAILRSDLALHKNMDPYHRDMMKWLVAQLEGGQIRMEKTTGEKLAYANLIIGMLYAVIWDARIPEERKAKMKALADAYVEEEVYGISPEVREQPSLDEALREVVSSENTE